MTHDEQARARLVEIALQAVKEAGDNPPRLHSLANADYVRQRAGFKNPANGSWCAAGLTAGMDDAGLVVPAPGTPARRGAIALLDFVAALPGPQDYLKLHNGGLLIPRLAGAMLSEMIAKGDCAPGDIIAWLQHSHPQPEEWRMFRGVLHAFAVSAAKSMCDVRSRENGALAIPDGRTKKCSACAWETRKGHVAVIVAVDDESVTTVGWNEGPSPGAVQMRKLWRQQRDGDVLLERAMTVLWRRPGGLYGVARPVAA
jgi:hypothetical protein